MKTNREAAFSTETRCAGLQPAVAAPAGLRVSRRGNIGWTDSLLALAFPTALWLGSRGLPAWVRMWMLVAGEVFAVKWLMLRHARACGSKATFVQQLTFLFAWTGTDAMRFFQCGPASPTLAGPAREWALAAVKTLVGIALLIAGNQLAPTHGIPAAWLGMVGLVLLGHFGLCHLLSLAWRAVGVDAPPLMRAPVAATSLAEFWGARWNLAFAVPARELLFKPFARRIGVAGATLAVFLVSGLLHETVISLPAGAGWGLPTAYFLFQGLAVLAERSAAGHALGLGQGARGWVFMALCTAGPAYWLFHPAFAERVVLPMLSALNPT